MSSIKAVLISIFVANALACAPSTGPEAGPKWRGTAGVVTSETMTVIVDGKATRVRVVR